MITFLPRGARRSYRRLNALDRCHQRVAGKPGRHQFAQGCGDHAHAMPVLISSTRLEAALALPSTMPDA